MDDTVSEQESKGSLIITYFPNKAINQNSTIRINFGHSNILWGIPCFGDTVQLLKASTDTDSEENDGKLFHTLITVSSKLSNAEVMD